MKCNYCYIPFFISITLAAIADALVCPRPVAQTRRLTTLRLAEEKVDNIQAGSAAVATTIRDEDGESSTTPGVWTEEELNSNLMKEVRAELIQKYLERDITQEQAEMEVDVFLADKDRAEKYLEMRVYANAQTDDLGIGLILQLLGGFFIGFLISVGPKYFHM